MCDATMAIMAIGAAISAGSAIQQADHAEDVARVNADRDRYAAEDALVRGRIAEDQHRQKVRQMIGRQKAGLAANGIDATTGTGGQILADTAAAGEYDALVVRNNAMREAFGLNTRASDTTMQGSWQKAAGYNNATSTLITAGSKAYAGYTKMPTTTSNEFGTGSKFGSQDLGAYA